MATLMRQAVRMKPLPLPLRLAAGVAVTTAERARELPTKIVGLPVTVVSQALQLSMRIQQQVTQLAIKGDDALASLRPVEDTPSWATFDEDTYADADGLATHVLFDEDLAGDDPGPVTGGPDALAGRPDDDSPVRTTNGHAPSNAVDEVEILDMRVDPLVEPEDHTLPEQRRATTVTAQPTDPWSLEQRALAEEHADGEFDTEDSGADDTPSDDSPSDGSAGDDSRADNSPGDDPARVDPARIDPTNVGSPGDGALAEARSETTEHAGQAAPAGLTGYDRMTLPQLRARLRKLSLPQLEEIIEYERAHENRPSFLGMLTRRINNVRDQQ